MTLRTTGPIFGLMSLRTINLSDQWPFGLLTIRPNGMIFGPMTLRTIDLLRTNEPSDQRPFGISSCPHILLLICTYLSKNKLFTNAYNCACENDEGLISNNVHKQMVDLNFRKAVKRKYSHFQHWLPWKLSFRQLPVQPVMKISSK